MGNGHQYPTNSDNVHEKIMDITDGLFASAMFHYSKVNPRFPKFLRVPQKNHGCNGYMFIRMGQLQDEPPGFMMHQAFRISPSTCPGVCRLNPNCWSFVAANTNIYMTNL